MHRRCVTSEVVSPPLSSDIGIIAKRISSQIMDYPKSGISA